MKTGIFVAIVLGGLFATYFSPIGASLCEGDIESDISSGGSISCVWVAKYPGLKDALDQDTCRFNVFHELSPETLHFLETTVRTYPAATAFVWPQEQSWWEKLSEAIFHSNPMGAALLPSYDACALDKLKRKHLLLKSLKKERLQSALDTLKMFGEGVVDTCLNNPDNALSMLNSHFIGVKNRNGITVCASSPYKTYKEEIKKLNAQRD